MWNPEEYLISVDFFLRLIGALYAVVFLSWVFQAEGLIGKKGILPLSKFLKQLRKVEGRRNAFFQLPMVYWISSSDPFLKCSLWSGVVAALFTAFGIFQPFSFLFLYILHLSIFYAGQTFMSFGWELLLIEMTVHAFFLSLTSLPNPLIWFSVNVLLMRFMLQAGTSKFFSKDPCWRDCTALSYHYLTQPIPNTQAFFADKLPLSFQRVCCALVLVIEVIVPFLMLGTQEMRFLTFLAFASMMLVIWFTGNFSYLNYQTLIFSLLLIADPYWKSFGIYPKTAFLPPLYLEILLYGVGAFLLLLQILYLYKHFMRSVLFSKFLDAISPLRLASSHQLFSVMTKKRVEIIIEGSFDGQIWQEYGFKYKPSSLYKRPRRIAPFQPRLDWQMWFLPFSPYRINPWFHSFLHKLLTAEPAVLSLLEVNPFTDKPPKYVRALAYDYTFASFQELFQEGKWWNRKLLGAYSPTLFLRKEEETL